MGGMGGVHFSIRLSRSCFNVCVHHFLTSGEPVGRCMAAQVKSVHGGNGYRLLKCYRERYLVEDSSKSPVRISIATVAGEKIK